ncbi:MAG: Ku protein [Peptococcia bacterium]
MAVAHKSVISFGLVAIPIAMYTATQDNDIRFNQLHKEDQQRIRYKKVCGHCNKEVTAKDIIKGYQYDPDHYVVVTDEEIEKIKTEKDKSIQILHFAQLKEISPIYYNKTYYTAPEVGGEKAFELLRAALLAEGKVAIGKTVLGSKETLLAIIPREDGLLLTTMYYEEDIKDLPKSYQKPEATEAELKLATTLIQSMDTPFDPAAYHDEYQQRLRELIEAKIAGKEIVAPQAEGPNNVVDLMDALKASIEKNKSKKEVKQDTKAKRGRKTKGA